ncbi:hypothetical protein D9M71_812750 [compost metagenome]
MGAGVENGTDCLENFGYLVGIFFSDTFVQQAVRHQCQARVAAILATAGGNSQLQVKHWHFRRGDK